MNSPKTNSYLSNYEAVVQSHKIKHEEIIELHCHTKMSEGGVISPDELVQYAYDKGYRAIAITDNSTVDAFPEAYKTWLELWNEYKDRCCRKGEEADINDFLKVIYGLEGNLLSEDGKVYPILLYAKNDIGIKNLYKIVKASNLEYFDKIPLIPRKYLDENRDGIIVGSVCEGGEVYAAINSKLSDLGVCTEKEYNKLIRKRVSYYDFLEVVSYRPFSRPNSSKISRYMMYETVNIGLRPMVATSDAYYLSEEDERTREKPLGDNEKFANKLRSLMNYNEDCKALFAEWHLGMPEKLRDIHDKVFYNRTLIANQIEYINPLQYNL